LTAIARRDTSKKLAPLTTRSKPLKAKTERPLFQPEVDAAIEEQEISESDDDMELLAAIEQSAADAEERDLQHALAASTSASGLLRAKPSSSGTHISPPRNQPHGGQHDDDDDLYMTPNRLETALSIAGAAPRRFSAQESARKISGQSTSSFGIPSLLLGEPREVAAPSAPTEVIESDSDADMEDVLPTIIADRTVDRSAAESAASSTQSFGPKGPVTPMVASTTPQTPVSDDEEDEMEEIIPPSVSETTSHWDQLNQGLNDSDISLSAPEEHFSERHSEGRSHVTHMTDPNASSPSSSRKPAAALAALAPPSPAAVESRTPHIPIDASITRLIAPPVPHSGDVAAPFTESATLPAVDSAASLTLHVSLSAEDSEDEDPEHWSRTPPPGERTAEALDQRKEDETWDAAHEMDPQAEEGDFVNFMSQVKGKDLDAVRKEIDEEIRVLNQQKKAALRDSEDVTHQMVSQIMVSPRKKTQLVKKKKSTRT
jgi:DNA excision repair protein ERCC-5